MSPAEDLGHPRNRWRVGHQAFLVVIQAMLLALTRFERAMVSNARDDARGALELSAILFRGAGAALRLAGDFDRDAYEAVIRPSMAGAHPQFSGLMNSDHRALIVKLRGLRAFFENMPESLARAHEEFVVAKRECIEAHVHVCELFQADGPSLRKHDGPGKAAVDVLTRLGNQRLRLVAARKSKENA